MVQIPAGGATEQDSVCPACEWLWPWSSVLWNEISIGSMSHVKIGKLFCSFPEPQFSVSLTTALKTKTKQPTKQTNKPKPKPNQLQVVVIDLYDMKEKMLCKPIICRCQSSQRPTRRRYGKRWADTEGGFSKGEMKRLNALQPRSLSAGTGHCLRSCWHKCDLSG